ncbi:hypothetical protein L602_002200000800 [Cupriavidus gilardii J11]|uniref:Uncharacterized protein n=1 Tax=Cupriavidus gilardii J11 TaxID=936133 RepID=A0A562BL79_9BURK|nr:hypothetical protein [Cupriavidus gilardii]TWG86025.1 hypothetical protein L602_002200000800 [Cupriavidus gilardii J11]
MNYPDSHPYFAYRGATIGEQLLRHYAARDEVRHATPLIPLRWSDVVRFVRSLFGGKRHQAA